MTTLSKQLREKLPPRISAEEKLEAAGGQVVLFTGTEFTARDKLGQSYRYRMIGTKVTRDGLTRLLNLDTGCPTYVEPAWFRERKVLQKEQRQDLRLQNGAEECTYTCWNCEKRYTCERYASL